MPPKAPDQKRKRGRPPGASKSKPAASSHEAPDHDAEPDPEERARPKKRGRKNEGEGPGMETSPSGSDNGPAQPPRVGRPPKKSQQTATANIQSEIEGKDERAKLDKKPTLDNKMAPLKGKRKALVHSDSQEKQAPKSSEHRQRGRVRRGSPSEATGTKQSAPAQAKSKERASKRVGGALSVAPKDKGKALAGKGQETASQTSPKEDEPVASAPRRSGRDRRAREPESVSSGSQQNHEQEPQPTTATGSGKPRTRAEGASRDAASPKAQQIDTASKVVKKRRGRPSVNNEDPESVRALQPQQGNRSKALRQWSGVDKTADASDSIEDSRPKPRGRPKRSDIASQESEPARAPRSRGRPRPRSPGPKPAVEQNRGQQQGQQRAPLAKNKQKQRQPRQLEPVIEQEEEASSEEEEEELPFRYLREGTTNIARSVISEKWNALDGPSINAVGTLLADAQRPVLLRLQNTSRRREHASAALSVISRRLHTKLARGFPFPPPTAGSTRRAGSGSHEHEFDFERAMNAAQGLENTLNPLLHSVSLLEREIKKEEDALVRDYDSLHKLEANARSEVKGWREKAKREHVLASGIRRKDDIGDHEDEGHRLELVVRPEDANSGGLFNDFDNEELVTLSKQIGSHMESMQGNLQQIGGVVPAINRSKAALQQVMQKHLDEELYDKVLLG